MRSYSHLVKFNGGEFSGLMDGRVDFAKYPDACRVLENFYVHPHGPASNRPGFRVVAEAKGTTGTRLIPFSYSTEQAYMLEFGFAGAAGYIRFYMDGGQIVLDWAGATELVTGGDGEAASVAAWTTVNSGALTSVAGGKAGNCFQLAENGADDPGFKQTIAVSEHMLYRIKMYTKAGTANAYYYEIWDETAGALIGASGAQVAPAAWAAAEDVDETFYTPIGCVSLSIRIYHDATNGDGTTVLFDTIALRSEEEPYEIASPYTAAHLPEVKYGQNADTMYLVHPSYAVRKLVRTAHTNWTLSTPAFAAGAASNFNDAATHYPSAVCFHENRLCFGCSTNDPVTVWNSKSGSYEDMTTGVADDDAIVIDLASDQVNNPQDLASGVALMVPTTGGEWRVSAVDQDEPMTPTNVTAKRETVHGAYNARLAQVGNAFLFIQREQRQLLELAYNWEAGGYIAPDRSVLAQHITAGGLVELAYQATPHSILWARRSDDSLVALTYWKDHDVFAWHRHPTEGDVISIATMPGTQRTELWAVTVRDIDGTDTYYIEQAEDFFDADEDETEDGFFVDCGTSVYAGLTSFTDIPAPYLWHLAGETVKCVVDGAVQEDVTVGSDGSATLPVECDSVCHLGFGYTAILEPMRPEVEGREGMSLGRDRDISGVIVRFKDTLGGKIGPDASNLDIIPARDADMAMDTVPDLFTGDTDIIDIAPADSAKHGLVRIVQDAPAPMTVVCIMPVLNVSGEI